MKKILLLLGIVFVTLFSTLAKATTNITDCTELSTVGETYYLTADISASFIEAHACMDITADDIVLDCQGHTILNIYTEYGVGVYGIQIVRGDAPTNTNVSIKNCNVADWYAGIHLLNAGNNTIISSTSNNNDIDGITFDWSNSDNQIVNSTFNNNGINGILIQDGVGSGSNNNQIINSTFNGNFRGIYIHDSANNQVISSVSNNNTQNGIYIRDCTGNNTIYGNIIQDNGISGMYISCIDQLFYNNMFNQTVPYIEGGAYVNNWNATMQAGIRIYSNGTQIGGNYWTNSTGNGYSDVCVDSNEDGFCDVPLDIAGGGSIGYDYLPLSDEYLISPPIPSTANVTIIVDVSQFVTPLTIVTDNDTYVEKYSGTGKTISLVLDLYHVYSVNITGNQIYPFLGFFNVTGNATFTATPRSSLTSSGDLLTDVGSGVGSFLSAITLGVTQIIIYIAIIMGVLSIVYAIAYVFKKFTGGND
jgi:parallel beta-helix repeat protein